MRWRGGMVGLLLGTFAAPSSAWCANTNSIFTNAAHQDDEGHAHRAYLLYLRAAEDGLSEAEFNVAVMLDSGRGVTANIAEAATWYARAASHGNHRAAYNLGQLYEAGEGVPKNRDLARAWYAASTLPAAQRRLPAGLNAVLHGKAFEPPFLVSPAGGQRKNGRPDEIEFVWTVRSQPEPVRYNVEVRSFGLGGTRRVFSASVATSSVLAKLQDPCRACEWRVVVSGRRTGRSIASDWSRFEVTPN